MRGRKNYFDMEFSTRFPHNFRAIFKISAFEMEKKVFSKPISRLRNSCGKYYFRIRLSSTKFHIKVRKPHFKLRKTLFKRGLERKCKNKNVLEFDVEKDGGIIFWKKNCLKKIILLSLNVIQYKWFSSSLFF